jgi:putative transposase
LDKEPINLLTLGLMPRKGRIEFEGALYHLLDRGDRCEEIVRDDVDRARFVATLGEVCERTGWRVHAFVLMTNHYHLLVETPQANLVAGMRWFQTTWTMRFNRRHRLSGHLFQGRYKSILADSEERNYFTALSDYIHLNPVRAGIIGPEQRLFDYRWSSYPFYLSKRGRPGWFESARVMGELGLNNHPNGRRLYAERMRKRALDERAGKNNGQSEGLRRGWCLGGPSFRERMLSLLEEVDQTLSPDKEIDAGMRRSYDEREASGIIEYALRYFELSRNDLAQLRKNDARKLAIARLIRRRTAVSNRWLASELALGHVSAVSRCGHANEETSSSEAKLVDILLKADCGRPTARFTD